MIETEDRFSPRTLLIWGVALVVALWLAMTAAGGIAKEVAPGIALSVYPQNGFAYQARLENHVEGDNIPIQKMKVSDADLADAYAALRREPFATGALTLIGVERGARHDAKAQQVVAAAHALDRRQLIANAWLINSYGTSGRDRDVLELLDEALKVRPQLTQQYMPAFALALQNPQTIPAFQTLLASHPAWEKDFWLSVAGTPASLPNAEVLRSHILAGPENLGPTDTLLMNAFVGAGRVDLALSYAKNLPTPPGDRDNLLRNASFSTLPVMPPLDWELINDGRLGSAIDESRGTLEISAQPGALGTVARQLVTLTPGPYVLLVKLGQADPARGSEISVRLHCAERDVPGAEVTEKLTGDLDQPFVIADSGCRFYWLDLDFSAINSSEPALGSIADISIMRGHVAVQD